MAPCSGLRTEMSVIKWRSQDFVLEGATRHPSVCVCVCVCVCACVRVRACVRACAYACVWCDVTM